MSQPADEPCPCRVLEQDPPSYARCCQPFHQGRAAGAALAPTAEQLMRSRYSAFVVQDAEYLLATWHPTTRPKDLELDPQMRWTGLEILSTRAGGPSNARGVVQFAAHYRSGGQDYVQDETSTFVQEDGYWFYVDAL